MRISQIAAFTVLALAAAPKISAQSGDDYIFSYSGPQFGGHAELLLNGSIKIPAKTTGWYTTGGANALAQNGTTNYITGTCAAVCANITVFRSYFVFDLSSVSGPITSAALNIVNPINTTPAPGSSGNGYVSPHPPDILGFFLVSTPIPVLTAPQTTRPDIWTALGSGTLAGSRYVDNSTNGTVVTTVLDATALGVITSSEGSAIAFGGVMNPPGITVTAPAVTGASVTPRGDSNTNISMSFSDSNGYLSLHTINFLINYVLDGRNACYGAVVPNGASSGTLYLVGDAGDAGAPLSSAAIPGLGTVANSQCRVSASISGTGDDMVLNLNLSFTSSFAGNKVVYSAANNTNGGNSNWQAVGTLNVAGPPPTGPSVAGVTPVHSTSAGPTVYSFTFNDTAGAPDITVANVLLNSAIDGRHACYVAYVQATNSVFLVDDAGDAGGPYQGLVLPSNNTIGNSQCTISGSGSSVQAAGNSLTLNLAVTFTPSFTGNRVVYLAARNNTVNSNWQSVGTVSVP